MKAASDIDVIETPRLIGERLRESHLDDLARLHLDPEVSKHIGGVRALEATKTYIAVNLAHWDAHAFGLWVLRTRDGAFAGRAGIRRIKVEGCLEVEVTYTFPRALWGQGLASEVTLQLLDVGLRQLELASLVGIVVSAHGASRRVLEKLKFGFERDVTMHGEGCVLYRRRRPL